MTAGRQRDDQTGRFLTGNNGGGRFKGSRNKLAAEFIEALHSDFNQNGISAIERVRKEKPDVYIRVVASILPKELDVALNVNHSLSEEYQRALTHADAMRVLREAAGIVGARPPMMIEADLSVPRTENIWEPERRDCEFDDRE
jgi:hypothetical protein